MLLLNLGEQLQRVLASFEWATHCSEAFSMTCKFARSAPRLDHLLMTRYFEGTADLSIHVLSTLYEFTTVREVQFVLPESVAVCPGQCRQRTLSLPRSGGRQAGA
jgi:hypothetical protein